MQQVVVPLLMSMIIAFAMLGLGLGSGSGVHAAYSADSSAKYLYKGGSRSAISSVMSKALGSGQGLFATSSTAAGAEDTIQAILSKIVANVGKHSGVTALSSLSSSSLSSLSAPSSSNGFVVLNSFTSFNCEADTAFFYSGIATANCIGDLQGTDNSYFFSCTDDNGVVMTTYNGPDCKVVNSTIIFTDVTQCFPYAYALQSYRVSCSSSKEIPVPVGTILETVYSDETCMSDDLLGYIGITSLECFDVNQICAVVGSYPEFNSTCEMIETELEGEPVSLQFSCALSNPSATVYIGTNTCKCSTFPCFPVPAPLPSGCTNSTLLMCQQQQDEPTSNDGGSSSSSNGGVEASRTGAIVGGVIGGIAGVSIVGYVAYTKLFSAGAQAITAKKAALASQSTLGNEL